MCASGDPLDSALGQRVEYQGFHGTVHYVGELAGQNGVWLGVEWDDPSRGKHNGSHNGVSYFETSHPTSGSFVRPTKVNFGISFVEALHNRYGKVEGSTGGVDEKELEEMKREFNIPLIEVVGFDKVNSKQSQFENLQVVQLRNQPVKCAGMEGEIASLCPLVVELDLSSTLVSSWKNIADITRQLKKLTHLDVSQNKILVPSLEETMQLREAFLSTCSLILNNLGYTWEEILICARMFSSVNTLCVQRNKIVSLESPSFGVLSNLTTLHMQMNDIKDWNYVNKLGNLTSLQALHLSEAGLTSIFFPGEGKTSLFPSLVELNLQSNKIDDWCSINELNKLTCLKMLQLQLNPLMQKPKAFDMIIARIKGLQKLNGTAVSVQERRGSEYDYMKCHGQEWISARDNPLLLREFHKQHPRFTELIEAHGSISEEDVYVTQAPLKSRLVNVKIVCPNLPGLPEFSRKVPKSMTIQKLNGLVQKLMNTGGCVPSLCAISAKSPGIEIPLEKDMQDLSFYSVEDGDTIAANW